MKKGHGPIHKSDPLCPFDRVPYEPGQKNHGHAVHVDVMGAKIKGAKFFIPVMIIDTVEILMGDNTALIIINAFFDEAVQLVDGVRGYPDSQNVYGTVGHFLIRVENEAAARTGKN